MKIAQGEHGGGEPTAHGAQQQIGEPIEPHIPRKRARHHPQKRPKNPQNSPAKELYNAPTVEPRILVFALTGSRPKPSTPNPKPQTLNPLLGSPTASRTGVVAAQDGRVTNGHAHTAHLHVLRWCVCVCVCVCVSVSVCLCVCVCLSKGVRVCWGTSVGWMRV